MKFFISIIMAAILTGCMVARETVETETDDFENDVTVLGYEIVNRKATERYKYFLRSFIPKDSAKSEVTHQVYFINHYNDPDWRFYNSASLKGGKVLETERIDGTVASGNSLKEHVIAYIDHSYLLSNKKGFKVKFSSKSGISMVVDIKKVQVKKHLEKVSEVKNQHW